MKILFISINKKITITVSMIITAIVIFSIIAFTLNNTISTSLSKEFAAEELKKMFVIRDKATLDNNVDSIKYMFDTSIKIGRWAYEHEKKRTEYLNNWTILRQVKFTSIESDVRVQRVLDKGSSIWIDLLHSGKFTYVYTDKPDQLNSFGIGTRRAIELVKNNDQYIIKREWYLDPFEDILEVPEELKNEIPQNQTTPTPQIIDDNPAFFEMEFVPTAVASKKRYDRDKAVAYADKYCGATFGSGNNYKYNRKYRDYTNLGGDCANFASQMLADPTEGGGLKMDGTWFYNFKYKGIGGGTRAWVKASTLRDYLLYSGKAKLLKKGHLMHVSQTASGQSPIYSQLQKGDLICYERKGNEHFSIVTGFDNKGWPLVNSHSTDRYRVPWDLGWINEDVKYWLLHIRD